MLQVDFNRRILFVTRSPEAPNFLDLSGDRVGIHPRYISYEALVKTGLGAKLFSEL
jgi:hypothetical protein